MEFVCVCECRVESSEFVFGGSDDFGWFDAVFKVAVDFDVVGEDFLLDLWGEGEIGGFVGE